MKLADWNPPLGTDQFPVEYMERRGLIKLGETGEKVLVGTTASPDPRLIHELSLLLGKPVQFHPIAAQDLSEFLSRILSGNVGAAKDTTPVQALDQLAHDAPIVNLVNSILLEGIRRGASDVHFEHLPSGARVRYRIDGLLILGQELDPTRFAGLSSRLKIMANLDIIERRLPQDGRLAAELAGRLVEFRISVVPLADGESIVLRLFHRQDEAPQLDELGFSEDMVATLRSALRKTNGLVLVTGPTGSGKTTTLHALVREIAQNSVKVITVEDPVETLVPGVNQIQTNETIGLSFDSILRRVLRQDPDILVVGEIRDKITAELCIRSALTGHLVLSTLHTNDALSAVPRLLNMGVEPYLLAAVLRCSAAQRLIRVLCPSCQGKGCSHCNQTGYRGRSGVGEAFLFDSHTEELLIAGTKHADLVHFFSKAGVPFLKHDLDRRTAAGDLSLEERQRIEGSL